MCKIVLKSKNYGKIKILPEVKLKQTRHRHVNELKLIIYKLIIVSNNKTR